MTRARHAMRPHPLRSPGVLVGVPVAAAVAFGAHAVLGIVPVADQATPAPSSAPAAAPQAAAPRAVERAAPAAAPAQDDGGPAGPGASGGSLASVDLGVAKVSLLSFGD